MKITFGNTGMTEMSYMKFNQNLSKDSNDFVRQSSIRF